MLARVLVQGDISALAFVFRGKTPVCAVTADYGLDSQQLTTHDQDLPLRCMTKV